MAGTTGLEPAASAVTGQRSNQLNYVPTPKEATGIAFFYNDCGMNCARKHKSLRLRFRWNSANPAVFCATKLILTQGIRT